MHDDDPDAKEREDGVSRRTFLKASGIPLAAVPVLIGPRMVMAADAEVAVHGPGKAKFTLTVNGQARSVEVEPRVTLLDALRNDLDVTGAKRVCDRGTCGACTVLVDGKPVYACTMLAIDAQGRKITTVESLAGSAAPSPAAGLRRPRRPAVRLLHARLRDGLQGASSTRTRSPRRPRSRRASAATSAAAAPTSAFAEAVAAASQGGTRG